MAGNDTPEREIYIIMDPHSVRSTSLDAVVVLAERLRARISARFLTNELLRQVAQLPFTTEVLVRSGQERKLVSESFDDRQQKQIYLIQTLLEQRARARKVAFRIEESAENISLQLVLENRRDLFLPAVRPSAARARSRPRQASPLSTIKWVYDNCPTSERCFGLLQDLVAADLTQRILVFGNKPIPRRTMAALAESGARVYWIEAANGAELLLKLQSGEDVDLVLLPASYATSLGEGQLRELNHHCIAPILVAG